MARRPRISLGRTTYEVIGTNTQAGILLPLNYLIAFLFLAAGLINFAPITGFASSDQLERLYRLSAITPDIELLLRHRAVLFGIIGTIIMAAAFLPALRLTATIAGIVSMVSFIALVFVTKNTNANLVPIAWIDVIATVLLILGFVLHATTGNQLSAGE